MKHSGMPGREDSIRLQAALAPLREEEFDLKDIFRILRRRLGTIIGTVIVFTTCAYLLALSLTPQYTAVSTIVVEPRDTRIINFDDERQNIPQDESMINTHVKVLTSNSFIRQTIDRLDLLANPEFNIALRVETKRDNEGLFWSKAKTVVSEALSWARLPLVAMGLANQPPPPGSELSAPENGGGEGRIGGVSEPWTLHIDPAGPEIAVFNGNEPPVGHALAPSGEFISDQVSAAEPDARTGEGTREWASLGTSASSQEEERRSQEEERRSPAVVGDGGREALVAAATEIFLGQLNVGPAGQSYAISVAFTSVDPEMAAKVANAMGELFVENQLESKRVATGGALDWLAGRLNELREQLVEAEKAAEAYREQNQLLATGRGVEFDDQELAALSQELIRARAERLATEAKLRRIQELRSSGESLDSVPEIMLSPVIANLRQMEMNLLREEAQLRQEFGPRHPNIIQIEADKDKLYARIDAEVQHVIGGLANQIATIQVREQTLQAKLEEAKAGSLQNSRAEIQLRLLEREAESTRTLYATFLDRFKQLTEQRQLLEPGVHVISQAAVPTAPSFPQVKLMTGAGFMGSLMFGMLLAFVVDRLDGGLRTGRQAETALNVPNIGLIPKVRSAVRGGRGPHLYLAQKPTSAYAEAIRSVQTALYFSNVDRPPQVVLVTSSLPAEGKTTLTLSLAALLAASGYKSVAIDLDLRAPTLGRQFRKAEGGDLIDYMKGQKKLDEILHAVDEVDNLDVIPTRRLAGSPTDLLASQRMAALMADLRARYQYIILDSPPLLGMSDSRFAAVLADAVVFVVRWNRTGEEVAQKALTVLRDSGTPVAGAVLTQVNVRRHRKYSPADVAHYHGRYKKYYVN